ncbi:MAG: AraC family transcriptional regulator [Bacteroidota bacterium]
MKQIILNIHYLDQQKAIEGIAKQLDAVGFQVVCDESILPLPSEIGQGTFRGINFPNGLGLFTLEATFKQPIKMVYKTEKVAPVRFFTCVKGKVIQQLPASESFYELNPVVGNICALPKNKIMELIFPADTLVRWVMLEIDRKDYYEKVKCDLKDMPDNLADILRDTKGDEQILRMGKYGIELGENAREIFSPRYEGVARKKFLESKTIEQMAIHIRHFQDVEDAYKGDFTLSEYDLAQIQQVTQIIVDDLQEVPTIPDMAKLVGLNESKLKRGFKLVYQFTIGKYIRKKRMEAARHLLLSNTMSIKEVAEEVGYSNASHFSNRFRNEYGVLPREIIKNGLHKVYTS